MEYSEWEIDFYKKWFPGWRPDLTDGVEFFHSEEKAKALERGWAKFVAQVRDNPKQYPDGFHHMGMHWSDIYSVLPKDKYKPGILRVAHRKLGPKNLICLRKERLPGGKLRWVVSYHWEGSCPACHKVSLAKRPEPAKLLRPSQMAKEESNGRPKLLLRKK